MQLQTLHISLCAFGPNEGKYTGKATFKNQYGGVEIALSPELSTGVLRLCADAIVQNSRELATKLTAETLLHVRPALPDETR